MSTIVVSGALANKCGNGGEAWVRLNWVLGFRKVGCRVFFVEEIQPQTCVDAAGNVCPFERCVNLAYFRQVTEQFGLAGSAALIHGSGERSHGLRRQELLDLADSADVLVNISGHLAAEALLSRFRRKVYIDIDPGFTQFWHAAGNTGPRLAGHDFYFTIGENIGTSVCAIPTGDIPWRPTRQPVVLEEWPIEEARVPARRERGEGRGERTESAERGAQSATAELRFTTVASWRGAFGPVQVDGKSFGVKVHEFRKFIELPQRVRQSFEIALDIHPADQKDRDALVRHGWQIADPKKAAGDPSAFRDYVQGSGAEFSVAQAIYVETNCGWFSDRTVRYLASGKPALVQETGFSRRLPSDEGLVAFRTLDEAVAGTERIAANYASHCRAARALAEDYFDSDKVLGRLLQEVM